MKNKKKKHFRKKMLSHYQLDLTDNEDNRSVMSIRLTPLNTLLFFASVSIFIVFLTFLILKYSPLKEYFISNQSSSEIEYKSQLLKINEKVLALEDSLKANRLYINAVQSVVSGNIKAETVDSLTARKVYFNPNLDLFKPTEEDSLFRKEIEREEMEALKTASNNNNTPITNFFTPVKGFISSRFDLTEKHLAIDISASEGESIKAIEDGDILFSNWTPETGYSMIIRHNNDVISMYKHCSKVFKEEGEEVKKGEAIAEVGSTGELTTGPHLHFELWISGNAVDPEEYIDF